MTLNAVGGEGACVMANRFGIALHDEQALRERDKTCVYCHKPMKTFPEIKAGGGVRKDLATIEHLNFDAPFLRRGRPADRRRHRHLLCRLQFQQARPEALGLVQVGVLRGAQYQPRYRGRTSPEVPARISARSQAIH